MPQGDADKYPTDSGRRRFVRGVVGSGILAGVATGGAAALSSATQSAAGGGGRTQYLGIENVSGPAPRSMPLVPVTVDDGVLRGVWPEPESATVDGRSVTVAEKTIGSLTYSSRWFQYCGVQTFPGVDPTADQDTTLRSPDFSAMSTPPYEWQVQATAPGDPLTVEHFADYETWGNDIGRAGVGKPAMAVWRSDGVEPTETIPIQVLRSTRIQALRENPPGGVDGETLRGFTTEEGFIAWLDKCTHFCCVPRFKSYTDSRRFAAADAVFCNCHQSVYDPFSPVIESFVALPRPD